MADKMRLVTDAVVLAPSVRYTRRNDRPTCPPHGDSWDDFGWCDRCRTHRDEPVAVERQVTVTNPDGSTTTHRYWSDH